MTPTKTALPDVLPVLRALSRGDKLRVIQQLAADLAQTEGEPVIEGGTAYPIWTPLDAQGAAAVLLAALAAEKLTP
jgi:hypothetical protein